MSTRNAILFLTAAMCGVNAVGNSGACECKETWTAGGVEYQGCTADLTWQATLCEVKDGPNCPDANYNELRDKYFLYCGCGAYTSCGDCLGASERCLWDTTILLTDRPVAGACVPRNELSEEIPTIVDQCPDAHPGFVQEGCTVFWDMCDANPSEVVLNKICFPTENEFQCAGRFDDCPQCQAYTYNLEEGNCCLSDFEVHTDSVQRCDGWKTVSCPKISPCKMYTARDDCLVSGSSDSCVWLQDECEPATAQCKLLPTRKNCLNQMARALGCKWDSKAKECQAP